MVAWQKDELQKVAATDDLHVSQYGEDEVTYGTPTWIWSVVVADAVYVRPSNGQDSGSYKAAVTQKSGRITAAGLTMDVTFEAADGPVNGAIDEADRKKHGSGPYLCAMIGERPQASWARQDSPGCGPS